MNRLVKLSFKYGPRYPWDKNQQSYILGGFFWGYLVTSLFGGIMAERWGGRHVVGISLFLSGLLTGLSPLMATTSFWPIFIARFALGVLGVSGELSNNDDICFPYSITTAR